MDLSCVVNRSNKLCPVCGKSSIGDIGLGIVCGKSASQAGENVGEGASGGWSVSRNNGSVVVMTSGSSNA
jgi:ribosomal protein S27AE